MRIANRVVARTATELGVEVRQPHTKVPFRRPPSLFAALSCALWRVLLVLLATTLGTSSGAHALACVGDCNSDDSVDVAELVSMVVIALQGFGDSDCHAGDVDVSGDIAIDELILAVRAALDGCQPGSNDALVTGVCKVPGPSGLDGCPVMTAVRCFACADRSGCLEGKSRRLLTTSRVEAGGGFTLHLSSRATSQELLVLEASLPGAVIYRATDFGIAGDARVRTGPQMKIDIDPSSESAAGLVNENGAEAYVDSAFSEINQRVRAANADLSFAGLSATEAAVVATETARADVRVRDSLEANRILRPNVQVTTDLNPAGDLDLFEFAIEARRPVVLQATEQSGPSGYDYVCIELRKAGELESIRSECQQRQVRFTLPLDAGRYSVLVSGTEGVIYNLVFVPFGESPGRQLEPDVPASGDLTSAGDLDLFEFTIQAGRPVVLQATEQSGPSGYDYVCIELRKADELESIRSECQQRQVRFTLPLDAGRYSVLVSGTQGVNYNMLFLPLEESPPTPTPTPTNTQTPTATGPTPTPGSQQVVFSDNFENGLGNWFPDNGVWEVGEPHSGPNACYSGSQCAATVLDGNYPNSNSSLVSPSITLPTIAAANEIHLRFWHWFSFASHQFGVDEGRIFIQEQTAPGMWSPATQLTGYAGTSGEVWTRPLVDLSAYAGKKIRLLFSLINGPYADVSSGWYLDDVSITVVQATHGVPYADGFENGLGNWWADNGTWQVGSSPMAGPESCHGGSSQCAATVLDGNYSNTNSDLVSPSITLPTIGADEELHLRFWHWFSFASHQFGVDAGSVDIQEQIAPGVWSAVVELTRYSGTSGGVWTRSLIDLSAYAGKNVRLFFGLVNGPYADVSAGWYVDDVEVSVSRTSVGDG